MNEKVGLTSSRKSNEATGQIVRKHFNGILTNWLSESHSGMEGIFLLGFTGNLTLFQFFGQFSGELFCSLLNNFPVKICNKKRHGEIVFRVQKKIKYGRKGPLKISLICVWNAVSCSLETEQRKNMGNQEWNKSATYFWFRKNSVLKCVQFWLRVNVEVFNPDFLNHMKLQSMLKTLLVPTFIFSSLSRLLFLPLISIDWLVDQLII